MTFTHAILWGSLLAGIGSAIGAWICGRRIDRLVTDHRATTGQPVNWGQMAFLNTLGQAMVGISAISWFVFLLAVLTIW